jgi:hypothetical protein
MRDEKDMSGLRFEIQNNPVHPSSFIPHPFGYGI